MRVSPYWLLVVLCVAAITAHKPAYATQWEVPASAITDHADVQAEGSLQQTLSKAASGDIVTLTEDALYTINAPLTVPAGVILRGKRDEMNMQKIIASESFPEDKPMLYLLGSVSAQPTTISQLHADGAHHAWNIVLLEAGKAHFLIEDSRLEKTRNHFNQADGGSYVSPSQKSNYYSLSLILANAVSNVQILRNSLWFAGVGETGKENGGVWSGKGSAIAAHRSKELSIKQNDIQFILSSGIDITGSVQVEVLNNTLKWVVRNSEYYDTDTGFTPPLGAGIFGAHNQRQLNEGFGDSLAPLHWVINNNTVQYSGQDGIHVGGNTIRVENNEVSKSTRSGIYAGDPIFDEYLPECTENTIIVGNVISESAEGEKAQTLWQKPPALPGFDSALYGDLRIDHHYGESVQVLRNKSTPPYWENSEISPWGFCGDVYEGIKALDNAFTIKSGEVMEGLIDKLLQNDIIREPAQTRLVKINDVEWVAGTPIPLANATIEPTEDGSNLTFKPNEGFSGVQSFTYTIQYQEDIETATAYIKVE